MSSIPRYRVGPDYLVPAYEDPEGKWVTFEDHTAAMTMADHAGYLRAVDDFMHGRRGAAHARNIVFLEGVSRERSRIHTAVAALRTHVRRRNTRLRRYYGLTGPSWYAVKFTTVDRDAVLNAIDGMPNE